MQTNKMPSKLEVSLHWGWGWCSLLVMGVHDCNPKAGDHRRNHWANPFSVSPGHYPNKFSLENFNGGLNKASRCEF